MCYVIDVRGPYQRGEHAVHSGAAFGGPDLSPLGDRERASDWGEDQPGLEAPGQQDLLPP